MWHVVVNAYIVKKLKKTWNALFDKYHFTHFDDIQYLQNIWLKFYIIHFCKCYINEILHFDIIIIFRVKNMHRMLKSHLKFFIDDLMKIIEKIEKMLKNQYKNYVDMFFNVKKHISYEFAQSTLYKNFVRRVISHVLWKIDKQYQKLKRTTKNEILKFCNRFYYKFMSLSCNHIIAAKIKKINQNFDRIFFTNVHAHWRFYKFEFEVVVIENFYTNKNIIERLLNDF